MPLHSLRRSIFLFSAVLLAALPAFAAPQDSPRTLREIRQRYLNQQVLLSAEGPQYGEYFLDWKLVSVKDGRYTVNLLKHLPLTYKGKPARVIVVQMNALQAERGSGVNAMGEKISEDDIPNPYVDIIVQFEDGTTAILTTYPNHLAENLPLAAAAAVASADIEKNLASIVGQKVYAVGFSHLYPASASLADISGPRERSSRMNIPQALYLEPLTIEKARYIPEDNAVVLKLILPDGSAALAYTPSQYLKMAPKISFLQRAAGTLLGAVPSLTPKELQCIRTSTIFTGMSGEAVDYMLGFPEKTNDYGIGGKQLVYNSGKLIVYLDRSNNVENWQTFN